jgi:hypothetical protein
VGRGDSYVENLKSLFATRLKAKTRMHGLKDRSAQNQKAAGISARRLDLDRLQRRR